ncbi:hypothetical protein V1511DRAFT_495882 [Dipodascopsis uninucleata]
MSVVSNNHLSSEESDIWKSSKIYIGNTQFETSDDIKNILVTGGEGFIASWIVRHLALQYPHYKVICLDNLDYCSSLNNTAYLTENCTNYVFVEGDITCPETVKKVLEDHQIDTVIHLAALSHVDLSFGGNSYQFSLVNAYGTHVLLECAKTYGKLRRFIHVSTDEVYGEVTTDDTEVLESAILSPTNPYAASKAAADMLANAYYRSFKIPLIIVRCNNVYGPHQFPEKIIPKFICLLLSGRKCLVHGDGLNTRRYLYAGDAVDAMDTILHKGEIGQIYNIGTSDEISNLDLCKLIVRKLGHHSSEIDKFIEHTHDRAFNDRRYAIDASRLKDLGWSQKTNFQDGLDETIDWYRRVGLEWWGDLSDVLTAFPNSCHRAYTTTSH